MPKRVVGIGNPSDHQKCSPKFWNISARLASISSADGACPYLANMPRPVLNGTPPIIGLRARTRDHVQEPRKHNRREKRHACWPGPSGPLQASLEVQSSWPISFLHEQL